MGPQPPLPRRMGAKLPILCKRKQFKLLALCGNRRERRERMPRASIIFRLLTLAALCFCTLHYASEPFGKILSRGTAAPSGVWFDTGSGQHLWWMASCLRPVVAWSGSHGRGTGWAICFANGNAMKDGRLPFGSPATTKLPDLS